MFLIPTETFNELQFYTNQFVKQLQQNTHLILFCCFEAFLNNAQNFFLPIVFFRVSDIEQVLQSTSVIPA